MDRYKAEELVKWYDDEVSCGPPWVIGIDSVLSHFGYDRLPCEVSRKSGAAVLTFGGLLRYRNAKTNKSWPSIDTIAKATFQSRSTTIRQLARLVRDGWIVKSEHDHKSTCYEFTQPALRSFSGSTSQYGKLPRVPFKELTLGEKLVFACLLNHWHMVEMIESVGNGPEGREYLSLTYFEERTGLSRRTVIPAIERLIAGGAIRATSEDHDRVRGFLPGWNLIDVIRKSHSGFSTPSPSIDESDEEEHTADMETENLPF